MLTARRVLAKFLIERSRSSIFQQVKQPLSLPRASAASFSRYPVPELSTLPDDLQKRLEKYALRNIFSAISYRPDELKAFLDYQELIMAERGSLTSADKEMIFLATSAANKCATCVVIHGAVFRIYSKNATLAEQISGNWETAELDDRQRAILNFAMDVCHCRRITDETITNLEKYGLSRDDAWDIASAVSFMSLVNRMIMMLDVKPNYEFHTMGRTPRSDTLTKPNH